jgi:hypothetical protein
MNHRSSHGFILGPAIFAVCLVAAGHAHAFVLNTTRTGGDCTKFGTWNSKTKVCTMNRDVSAEESSVPYTEYGYQNHGAVVKVDAAGITLDGNGHSLYRPAAMTATYPDVGIVVLGRNLVTIKNLTVAGFTGAWGIDAVGSTKTRVANFTAQNVRTEACYFGISLIYTKAALVSGSVLRSGIASYFGLNDRIVNNAFYDSSITIDGESGSEFSGNAFNVGMIFGYDTNNGNIIAGNSFVGSALYDSMGVDIAVGTANTIRDNTFGSYSVLRLGGSGGNVIYHNNFLSNYAKCIPGSGPNCTPDPVLLAPNIMLSASAPDTLNLPAPTGGNYYNFYDEATEGCVDANGDGFCDAPLAIVGNGNYAASVDNLPFVRVNGWK